MFTTREDKICATQSPNLEIIPLLNSHEHRSTMDRTGSGSRFPKLSGYDAAAPTGDEVNHHERGKRSKLDFQDAAACRRPAGGEETAAKEEIGVQARTGTKPTRADIGGNQRHVIQRSHLDSSDSRLENALSASPAWSLSAAAGTNGKQARTHPSPNRPTSLKNGRTNSTIEPVDADNWDRLDMQEVGVRGAVDGRWPRGAAGSPPDQRVLSHCASQRERKSRRSGGWRLGSGAGSRYDWDRVLREWGRRVEARTQPPFIAAQMESAGEQDAVSGKRWKALARRRWSAEGLVGSKVASNFPNHRSPSLRTRTTGQSPTNTAVNDRGSARTSSTQNLSSPETVLAVADQRVPVHPPFIAIPSPGAAERSVIEEEGRVGEVEMGSRVNGIAGMIYGRAAESSGALQLPHAIHPHADNGELIQEHTSIQLKLAARLPRRKTSSPPTARSPSPTTAYPTALDRPRIKAAEEQGLGHKKRRKGVGETEMGSRSSGIEESKYRGGSHLSPPSQTLTRPPSARGRRPRAPPTRH
ncbi:hypothetical protein B0H16DRAFT_1479027 [Mycena metata]|uniref:Uncharacterized protein n=1 Tax=Mycena metata TaxID=1033252 RepID=A0AAD7H659_9AGAR|nr:hypothetical protein B0H16DRAFT_1479027 [Mycena metata]